MPQNPPAFSGTPRIDAERAATNRRRLIKTAQQRLAQLTVSRADGFLSGGLTGLEKESLRIDPDGAISQRPHPRGLGSALTHPHITTDFSEALIELITPPLGDIHATLGFLHDLHVFVFEHLEAEERLWAASMPCRVEGDGSVPIARYGSSNVGMMKHVYRVGLSHRYGRIMQAIAGVHFNYSLPRAIWRPLKEIEGDASSMPDFVSGRYFALIRNFQRMGWILPCLFGTSPALCRSFLGAGRDRFDHFDEGTRYLPHATSLRMSDIGYKNKSQAGLEISYDGLDRYVESLARAIETPSPEFERFGVHEGGEYRQLNCNVLQIENEYYSFVRPKQVARSGEKPTVALRRRGVEYVEIRALDVSPFAPLGIDETQLRFLEALLILCLLTDSPPIDASEAQKIDANQELVARRGRDPHLVLHRREREQRLCDWAAEILDSLHGICECLDAVRADHSYRRALDEQLDAIRHPEGLPSARVLDEMRGRRESFFEFGMRKSDEHAATWKAERQSVERQKEFTATSEASLRDQARTEAADRIGFAEYLRAYFAEELDAEMATAAS